MESGRSSTRASSSRTKALLEDTADFPDRIAAALEADPALRANWTALPLIFDDRPRGIIGAVDLERLKKEIDDSDAPGTSTKRIRIPKQLVSWGILGFKLLKTAKAVKATLAAASFGAYAWLFTWEFAAVILSALVIHEAGHCWAMRRCGIPTRGFYLIPFVGGAAVPERDFRTRDEEVFVAAMGPTFGLASILVLAPAMYVYDGLAMAAGVAAIVAFLNFFNLLPITPLDGGRIVKCVTMSLNRWVGLAVLGGTSVAAAAIAWEIGAVGYGLIVVLSVLDLISEYARKTPVERLSLAKIAGALAWWLALGGVFLFVMAVASHIPGAEIAQAILQGAN